MGGTAEARPRGELLQPLALHACAVLGWSVVVLLGVSAPWPATRGLGLSPPLGTLPSDSV